MLLVPALLALLAPVAGAAECEPLDEAALRSLVLDAQAAVDRDDRDLHVAIVDEITARLPCLEFAPAPRTWADTLVNLALVEFGRGGDWQTPLAAAVAVRPTVDRGVGPGHPMGSWQPPEVPEPEGTPAPEELTLWVDGRRSDEIPAAHGLHLVQREHEGVWATVVLVDEAVDPAWLEAKLVAPTPLTVWWSGNVGLGAGGVTQLAWAASGDETFLDSDYLPSGSDANLYPGASLRALARYGHVGAILDVDLAWSGLGRNTGAGGQGVLAWTTNRSALGVGVGLMGVDAYEGRASFADVEVTTEFDQAEEDPRGPLVPPEPSELTTTTWALSYAAIQGLFRHGRNRDSGLALGIGGAGLRIDLHTGGPIRKRDQGPWRWGLTFAWNVGAFGQRAFPERFIVSSFLRLGLEIGFAQEVTL